MKEMVRLQGITKKFGNNVIIPSLDLTIYDGEFITLLGPSGCGKTTLLRMIAGLETPTEGSIYLDDENVTALPPYKRDVNMVFQHYALFPHMTVEENIKFGLMMKKVPADEQKERVAQVLYLTQLEEFRNRRPQQMSGGQQQRVAIARALVNNPKVLLLDEPLGALDYQLRKNLQLELKNLQRGLGLTFIYVTHDQEEALTMSDRIVVMNKGVIEQDDNPDNIYHYPSTKFVAKFIGESNFFDTETETLALRPEKLPATLGKWQLAAQPAAPRLEDGFMILLHRDAKPEDKQLELTPLEPGTYQPVSPEVSIKVENLVKKFGDFTAVSHTSFQVHRGEVFGLLGPNGAGKTTTFRMLCGLLPATEGVLSVAGENLRTARTQARAKIGYVAQKFSLYSKLSVLDNLQFFGGIYGIPPKKLKERIKLILEEFRLEGMQDKNAGDLPGGYKQRLSMACALLQEPEILFLDEPTSGIDPLARRLFWRQITDLAMKGTTIIVTTHFMEEAEYCDRIMIQDRGEMLIVGSAEEIRQQLHKPRGNMDELFIDIVHRARAAKGEENHAGHHQ